VEKTELVAAAVSPVLGLICGVIAWLVAAQKLHGNIGVDRTGSNYPMLAGNVASLLSPCIFVPFLTFAFGADNYDWESMRMIRICDDKDLTDTDVEVTLEQTVHIN
jgi:predicted lysophospholipase L1 biosynthesis ABC-type transport system permease subunit